MNQNTSKEICFVNPLNTSMTMMFCYFHQSETIKYMVISQRRKGIQALCTECKQDKLNPHQKILKIEKYLDGLAIKRKMVFYQTQVHIQKINEIMDYLIEDDVKIILNNYLVEVAHFKNVLPYYNEIKIEDWAVIEGILEKMITSNNEVRNFLQKILTNSNIQSLNLPSLVNQIKNVIFELGNQINLELQTLFDDLFDQTHDFNYQEAIFQVGFMENNDDIIILGKNNKIEIWSLKGKNIYQKDCVLETNNTNITELNSINDFLIGSSEKNQVFIWRFINKKWVLENHLFDCRLLFESQLNFNSTLYLIQTEKKELEIILDILSMKSTKTMKLHSEISKACLDSSKFIILCYGKIIHIIQQYFNFMVIQILQYDHNVVNIQFLNHEEFVIQQDKNNFLQIFKFNSTFRNFAIEKNLNNILLLSPVLKSLEVIRVKNYIILNFDKFIQIVHNKDGVFDSIGIYEIYNTQTVEFTTYSHYAKWNQKLQKVMIIGMLQLQI